MSFPSPSNFTTSDRQGVYWESSDDGATFARCATSGYAFIRLLQGAVQGAVSTPTLSYDNQSIVGTDVVLDAKWAGKTQRALWVSLRALGAPDVFSNAVAAEGRASRIGVGSIAAAAWLFGRLGIGNTGRFTRVASTVVGPRWGVAPPNTGDVPVVCTGGPVPSVDISVDPYTPPAPTPDPVPRPPGVNPPARIQQGGVPWGYVATVVLGVGALGFLGYSLRDASKVGKMSPKRARAKRSRTTKRKKKR